MATKRGGWARPPVIGSVARTGLLGLIHPPFVRGRECSDWSLEHAIDMIAERCEAFVLPPLSLVIAGGRLAVAPLEPQTPLTALVRAARRTLGACESCTSETPPPAPVPPVLDEGRLLDVRADGFHLPLTDPLPRAEAQRLADWLRPSLSPLLAVPRPVEEIALLGDPGEGRPMRVLTRLELRQPPKVIHPFAVSGRIMHQS